MGPRVVRKLDGHIEWVTSISSGQICEDGERRDIVLSVSKDSTMRYWTFSRSSSSSSFSFSPSKPATTNLTKIESSSSSMISSQITTTTTTSINSIPGTFNSPVFSVDCQNNKASLCHTRFTVAIYSCFVTS